MKATCLRTIIALSVLAGFPPGGLAQSDTIIIPRQQPSTTIPLEWLSDGGIAPQTAFSPPSRGSLGEINDGLRYTPGGDFFAMGFDHFHYRPWGQGGWIFQDVYLVADLREVPLTLGAFNADCSLKPGWTAHGDITIGSAAWADGFCFASVEASSMPAFLSFQVNGVPPDTGPGGGNTGMSLDPGGPVVGEGNVVLSAHDGKGDSIFEVVQEGMALRVKGRQKDGPMLTSAPIALPEGPVRIDLGWWLARRPQSQDGGAWLTIDGELQGQVLGLDNFGPEFRPWEWRFGSTQGPPQGSGILQVGDSDIWESPEPPVFAPLFADSAETGDLSLWSALINPQNMAVVNDAGFPEIEVQVTPGIPNALVDTSPEGLQHYNARFTIDTARLNLPADQSLTIFRSPRGQGPDLFRVVLDRATDDTRFRVRVLSGDAILLASVASVALPAADRVPLGVRWWAGSTSQPGGVILVVNGEERMELSIQNAGSLMGTTELGVLQGGTKRSGVGTLRFDEFEAWH